MKLPLASRILACIGVYSFVSALYTWFVRDAVAWFEILFGALCVVVLCSMRFRRHETSRRERTPIAWLVAAFAIGAGITLGLNTLRNGSLEAFHTAGLAQAIVVGLITVAFCIKPGG